MQDELGSPLRVLYESGRGEVYGYDVVGDTYFAQAREYQPAYGRFLAEDIRRGRTAIPKTRNRYGYCWNNPVGMVDLNGMEPELPGAELVFPQLSPQKDSIDSQLSEFVKPYEVLGFDEKEKFPSPIEFLDESGSNSNVRIIEEGRVYIISITTTAGLVGYGSKGIQWVFDGKGNSDIQETTSGGGMNGFGLSAVISFGYLDVPTVEGAKGKGSEAGLSGGGPIVGGVNSIAAYDEQWHRTGEGMMFSFGLGTPGLDVHGGVTYADSLKE